MKNLLILALLILTTTAQANDKKSNPYELPTYNGKPIDYGHVKPFKPLRPADYYRINNLTLDCYPGSFMNLDITLKLGRRESQTITEDITNNLSNSGNFASIVATAPLYSTKAVERERDRETRRREIAAKATASLIKSLEELRHTNRMLSLYESLEQRSQLRVKKGITEINEQIGYLEKNSNYYAQQQTQRAELKQAKLTLLGFCPTDSAKHQQLKKYLETLSITDK
jgi:hypothetical protein